MEEDEPSSLISANLRDYIKRTKKIIRVCRPTVPKENLDNDERQALAMLRNQEDLYITKADKGDTVVIMTTAQYCKMAFEHLDDDSTYTQLSDDSTNVVVDGITNYIVHLRNCGIIDDYTANFLLPPIRTRTQLIYFLPKLHKNPISFRPIVSGCSGPTESVSAYIDHFLQPYIRLVPSYIKNSAHLINILAKREFSDCRLVTLDVSSLYTNISHEDTLTTLDLAFEKEEVDLPYALPLSVLKTLLKHVLENNIFSFNGQVYQ